MKTPVEIDYFSDALCIWAYIAEVRMEELRTTFGGDVLVKRRRMAVFDDTHTKLAEGWRDRGGFDGYAEHVRSIAARFPHVIVSPQAWTLVRPRSSLSAHLYLSAIAEWSALEGIAVDQSVGMEWALRRAFFEDGLDIGTIGVQTEIARSQHVDVGKVKSLIDDGTAYARLSRDQAAAVRGRIEGSPTLVFNEGRQKLYGNVGFRVIEANVRELLRAPLPDQASWC